VLVRVVGLEVDEGRARRIHITVEDTGIGIPEDMVDHIFGEFNQVEDERNRSFDGTGLGLAITRQLVEKMGGEIWVESEPGKGSCFGLHVTLPVADEGELPELRRLARMRRALIIDAEKAAQGLLARQLEVFGLEVECLKSGEAALDQDLGTFDVIFADQTPPDMDVSDLVSALKTGAGEAPVVLLASDPNPDGGLADLVMRKPALPRELYTALQKLEEKLPSQDDDDAEVARPTREEIRGVEEVVLQDDPAATDEFRFSDQVNGQDGADAGSNAAPRRMRVLAAEDNRTNQLVFSKMVKDLEIELRFANNGREAVDAYREFRPDMIFMDISMPEMDGKEATRAIREIEKETGAHVPIVALTAHAMEGDGQEIMAAGLDHYLTKPLRKAAIIGKIEELRPEETIPVLPEVEREPGAALPAAE